MFEDHHITTIAGDRLSHFDIDERGDQRFSIAGTNSHRTAIIGRALFVKQQVARAQIDYA